MCQVLGSVPSTTTKDKEKHEFKAIISLLTIQKQAGFDLQGWKVSNFSAEKEKQPMSCRTVTPGLVTGLSPVLPSLDTKVLGLARWLTETRRLQESLVTRVQPRTYMVGGEKQFLQVVGGTCTTTNK